VVCSPGRERKGRLRAAEVSKKNINKKQDLTTAGQTMWRNQTQKTKKTQSAGVKKEGGTKEKTGGPVLRESIAETDRKKKCAKRNQSTARNGERKKGARRKKKRGKE